MFAVRTSRHINSGQTPAKNQDAFINPSLPSRSIYSSVPAHNQGFCYKCRGDPGKKESEKLNGIPSHWVGDNGSGFKNPWPSFRNTSLLERLTLLPRSISKWPSPSPAEVNAIPIHKPTWGLDEEYQSKSDKIKATWLGHACFLVEFPFRGNEKRGARILFDPVFSDRCSPSQWIGPKRFTPPPCKVKDIPEVDAIHNHYDHMDNATISSLFKRSRTPHVFAPLGNGPYFKSLGIPATHTHKMDWWDSKRLAVTLDAPTTSDGNDTLNSNSNILTVDITCTPAQHFTGRTPFDIFKTLWASWAVEEVPSKPLGTENLPAVKAFFAGDTGYRSVLDGQNEDTFPVCSAFKEIGKTFGGFDFAVIPIGAYMPRQFMSPMHCAPQDSVRLFKDINAKKALGMHFSTWILTTEDVFEPPKRLAEECVKQGVEDGAFGVCDIGDTVFF